MIIYNGQWLQNNLVQQEAAAAYADNLITQSEKDAAIQFYPSHFYSPNIFIRIGLFILTVLITSFTLGLFFMFFTDGYGEKSIGIQCIFFGIAAGIAAEWIVRAKHHRQSGVDDALMWMCGILLIAGINLLTTVSAITNAWIILCLALYFTIRFADRLMAGVLATAIPALIFLIIIQWPAGRLLAPFVLMATAALIYIGAGKIKTAEKSIYYRPCVTVIELTALMIFYIAGNYYAVSEAQKEFFNAGSYTTHSIPFGWFFWACTFLIPLVYIFRGMQKKDLLLIRTGAVLCAAAVYTFRFYYHVFAPEIAMIVAGTGCILLSWWLGRLLQQGRAGFTSRQKRNHYNAGIEDLEAIIIADTAAGDASAPNTNFGGGSFGGGGASAEF